MADTNKFVYVMSHGRYSQEEKIITIPNNIRLIQYSLPKRKMTSIEYAIIYKNKHRIVNRFYLVNKNNGKTYSSEIHPTIYHPNQTTLNLDLDFTGERIGVQTGVDGFDEFSDIRGSFSLEYILNSLSCDFRTKYPNKIIDVVQLSCRVGDYSVSHHIDKAIDEVIKTFSTTTLYPNIENLYNEYIDYFKKNQGYYIASQIESSIEQNYEIVYEKEKIITIQNTIKNNLLEKLKNKLLFALDTRDIYSIPLNEITHIIGLVNENPSFQPFGNDRVFSEELNILHNKVKEKIQSYHNNKNEDDDVMMENNSV